MNKVIVERSTSGVAVVRLNRPERMNALDDEMLGDLLPRVLADIESDDAIGALVVTGEGGAFTSGADLDGTAGWTLPDPASVEDHMRISAVVPLALREMSKPSIAAVHGPAVGAGFGLALACDFRIVGAQALFSAPFVSMGLTPDFGTSYFLPRLVGVQNALDLAMTGRRVGAEEAVRLGIAWRLADDPLAEAIELAARLAAMPRRALATTRQAIYRGVDADLRDVLLLDEPRNQSVALRSAEFEECIAGYRAQMGRG